MAHLIQFEEFFKMSNILYTSVGIQPYEMSSSNRGMTVLRHLLFYFGITNICYMFVCYVIFVVAAFYKGDNILEAIMALAYMGYLLVGVFKMLFVWHKKAALIRFVNSIEDIFPLDRGLQKEYNLSYYSGHCRNVTVGFTVLYMTLIFIYNFYTIVQYIVYSKVLQIRDLEQELPYTMYYVWDWRGNWSYYLMYFLQSFAGYTSTAGQISADLMLCAFATQLVMHYDYVTQTITNYEVKNDTPGIDRRKGLTLDNRFIGNMIERHAKLLDLSNQMNSIFGVPLLLNFATSSFIICFVGFQMSIGAGPDILFKLFLFLVSSISQFYLICHYGQRLQDSVSG